jgi:hypothetical protein
MTYALAGLLSLAMASTSASALVCDLSCSLGPTHADCTKTAESEGARQATASASSDMNMAGMEMASENAEQMPAEDTGFRGRPSASVRAPVMQPGFVYGFAFFG